MGCGIDVHKKIVVAIIIDSEGIKKETKEFETFTSSLTKRRDRLLKKVITQKNIILDHNVSRIFDTAGCMSCIE